MFESAPAWVTAQVSFRVLGVSDIPGIDDIMSGFPFNALGGSAIVVSIVAFWLALLWGSGVERVLVIAAIIGLWAYWGLQSFGLFG